MKTYFLKFKTFILIALISFSFVSCSGDEEEEKSFLETHGGTVWKIGEPVDGFSVYAQINSTANNPFEIWVYDEVRDCYEYQKITDDGSTEVIENRENKVQIRIADDSDEYVMLTMTISGNILRVELDYYEDGVLDDEVQFILERTSDNISDLNVCGS